ncbi:TonB family protein [Hymenobacter sp. BT770]|uniref:energy transducer TonB n=1 Tax=Hymenobacter sp. BT770 TaxID=2886942 RepID=UPI001D10D075|nr:energy transducer TonB [Hymenobacter sp. BT770]MCC3155544.1 TonB family protein [Hymenobacter sp. BT770]MDO3417524.1 TonB family protein [Hymenobacter sp. BT770]
MDKRYLLLLLLGGLGIEQASAQQIVPPTKTEYIDSTGAVLPSEIGAIGRRETTYTDSVGGVVRSYARNGKLRSSSSYEHIRKQFSHGVSESWFDNGQLSYHSEFAHNKQVGEFRTYYANGQLKRRQIMDAAHAGTGECFLENGQPTAFFEYEVMPVYSEGEGGFRDVVKTVMMNVKYPKEALRAKAEGRVFVSFVVTNKGEVANIKVVKSVFPSPDAAAVWAVQQLKSFTPGKQDGQPVAVSFTVPITFRMQ